jgi:hypothetical protein
MSPDWAWDRSLTPSLQLFPVTAKDGVKPLPLFDIARAH